MRIKRSARVFGLQPVMWFAWAVCVEVYRELNNLENCVLTSGTDGKHKDYSNHYKGFAFDLRVWGFEEMGIALESVAEMIRERLNTEFEVIVHETHLHIAFDPKHGLNK